MVVPRSESSTRSSRPRRRVRSEESATSSVSEVTRDDASDVIFDEGDDSAPVEKPASTVRRRKVATRRRATEEEAAETVVPAPVEAPVEAVETRRPTRTRTSRTRAVSEERPVDVPEPRQEREPDERRPVARDVGDDSGRRDFESNRGSDASSDDRRSDSEFGERRPAPRDYDDRRGERSYDNRRPRYGRGRPRDDVRPYGENRARDDGRNYSEGRSREDNREFGDDRGNGEERSQDGGASFESDRPRSEDGEFDRNRRGRGRGPRRPRNPLEARNYRTDEREDRFDQNDVQSDRFDSEVQDVRDLQAEGGEGEFFDDDGGDGEPRRRRRRRRRRPGGGGPNNFQQGGYQQPGPGYGGGGGGGGPRGGYRDSQGGPGRGGRGRGPQGRPHQPRQDRGNDYDRGGDFERDPRGSRRRQRSIAPAGEVIEGIIEGVLEMHPKGYGFLRDPNKNYVAQESDAFVPSSFVEKNKLREGVLLRAEIGAGIRNQGPRLKEIILVDGRSLEEWQKFTPFDEQIPVTPYRQIRLERGTKPVTMRVMDLVTPVGMGQRALIVAPPRTGKTMLLQDIADSVSHNHPDLHLMVLLVDERPEEVTEMRRRVKGEVVASSMDLEVENHVRVSQLIIERGKRMAEMGKDVFILMDSITRMARAFNKWTGGGYESRTMTGGLSVKALDIPKKLFGTARQFDGGGSLTIVATALIDTGSKMDEVIFQEFKGTGNMELVLSRDLADRRVWPAIDITRSGTRHEEKLFDEDILESVTMLRRSLISLSPVEAMEHLTKTLDKFPTNREFLGRVKSLL